MSKLLGVEAGGGVICFMGCILEEGEIRPNSFFEGSVHTGHREVILQSKMVSRHQEQHSIMNFAVSLLKMLTLYLLWRAQFSLDFNAVFCIHQILILLPF